MKHLFWSSCASQHLLEMPLTQELSLEKNLAILFKSPPELNIGKQYPVRLKRCLAFCGLGHFMVRCAEIPLTAKAFMFICRQLAIQLINYS